MPLASPESMQAASVVFGVGMALWIAVGFLPSLNRQATALRLGILVLFVAALAWILLFGG